LEAAGIEPACEIDATDSAISSCETQPAPRAANALHGSDSNCLRLSSLDADLQEIIAAWKNIARNIRQAILVLAHFARCDVRTDRI
jgi:hypothetical protein